jgi:hypothetical protein
VMVMSIAASMPHSCMITIYHLPSQVLSQPLLGGQVLFSSPEKNLVPS